MKPHCSRPGLTCTSGCGTQCHFFCGICGLSCLRGLDGGGPPGLGCPLYWPKPGSDTCSGSGCDPTGNDDDDDGCDGTQQVGSACSVQCPETVVPWTTITGDCKTTCTSTSTTCSDTDSTTTSTSYQTIPYPASVTWDWDPLFTPDLSAPADTSVYGSMLSWEAEESSAAAAPTTTFVQCTHQDEDPGLGIATLYCVCSGSTFIQSVTAVSNAANSCAYTTLPAHTINPITPVGQPTTNQPLTQARRPWCA